MSNPLQPNTLIEMFCKEYGLDKKTVKAILELYWKEIRNELHNLDNNRVRIDGIGTFEMRPSKVKQKLETLEILLNSTPPTSYQNYAKYYKLQKQKQKLEEMYKRFETEKEEKLNKRKQKWERNSESDQS
jgi:nucleoid DNA-binding protein